MRIRPYLDKLPSLLVVIFLLSIMIVGCKSESSKKIDLVEAKKQALNDDVLKAIPDDSPALVYWDLQSDGYQKFKNSEWGASVDYSSSPLSKGSPAAALLIKAGLDLEQDSVRSQVLQRGVVFAPGAANGDPVILFVSAEEFGIGNKLQKLIELSASEEWVTTKLEADGLELYSITPPKKTPSSGNTSNSAALEPESFVLGWKDNRVCLSEKKELVSATLLSSKDTLPKLLEGQAFKRGFKDGAKLAGSFAWGILDVAKSSVKPPLAVAESGEFAFETFAFSMQMLDVPSFELRMVTKEGASTSIPEALKATTSSSILAEVSDAAMLFLSIDGQVVKDAVDAASKSAPSPELQDIQPVVEKVNRLSLTAKAAPAGQSFLPIPDLALIIETGDPAGLRALLIKSLKASTAGMEAQGSGGWSELELEGQKVDAFRSPMGVGAFIGEKERRLYLSSSQFYLSALLGEKDSARQKITAGLSDDSSTLLLDTKTPATTLVNFEKVADFLRSMQGLLAMYAPQVAGSGDMSEFQKMIDAIKSLKRVAGGLSKESDALVFQLRYEKALPAANAS